MTRITTQGARFIFSPEYVEAMGGAVTAVTADDLRSACEALAQTAYDLAYRVATLAGFDSYADLRFHVITRGYRSGDHAPTYRRAQRAHFIAQDCVWAAEAAERLDAGDARRWLRCAHQHAFYTALETRQDA